jgi:hypothetical protein
LRRGDVVEIRAEAEIRETLDASGTLDSLPFMPEMLAHCGRRARVVSRVEKIWDMAGGTGLRRLRDTVLLEGLRCDGSGHDGCESGCYLLWKEAWLRRPGAVAPPIPSPANGSGSRRALPLADCTRRHEGTEVRYICQATQLPAASSAMSQSDPRHFVREILNGNVGAGRFVRGVAIALFNWVQGLRGGVGYPVLVPRARGSTPTGQLGLRAGALVAVRTKRQIEETLDARCRNRGLFFDLDMLRYCGGRFRVLRTVQRLIEESSGRMVDLRSPCVILEGVEATGEYHAFRAQREHILWREIWLERLAP